MTNVRSCSIKDCTKNTRAGGGHCTEEHIDIGKHPIHGGFGCLAYTRDNDYLREQLKVTLLAKSKEA